MKMDMLELLAFTRMTGDLVKAMRSCRSPLFPPLTAFAPAPAP